MKSEIPEGATHYNPHNTNYYRPGKDKGTLEFYVQSDNEWHESYRPVHYLEDMQKIDYSKRNNK